MKKFRVYSVLSLICSLLFSIFTIINCVFACYDIDTYFNIININSSRIDLFLIENSYLLLKVFAFIMLIAKISLFILFPIISYAKKSKILYVIQVILVFLDVFFSCSLPANYFISILNVSYHALLLVLLGNVIKRIDDLEYY